MTKYTKQQVKRATKYTEQQLKQKTKEAYKHLVKILIRNPFDVKCWALLFELIRRNFTYKWYKITDKNLYTIGHLQDILTDHEFIACHKGGNVAEVYKEFNKDRDDTITWDEFCRVIHCHGLEEALDRPGFKNWIRHRKAYLKLPAATQKYIADKILEYARETSPSFNPIRDWETK